MQSPLETMQDAMHCLTASATMFLRNQLTKIADVTEAESIRTLFTDVWPLTICTAHIKLAADDATQMSGLPVRAVW